MMHLISTFRTRTELHTGQMKKMYQAAAAFKRILWQNESEGTITASLWQAREQTQILPCFWHLDIKNK